MTRLHEPFSLHEALSIPVEKKHVVSVCGSGGKTSLINFLSVEAAACGVRACCMTTTRFMRPDSEAMPVFYGFSPDDYEEAWRQGKVVVAGVKGYDYGIRKPVDEAYDWLMRQADAIYIEADGAKMKPLKFPAEWEPVIPHETDHLIVVGGLTALGQPLADVCHRMDAAIEALGIEEDVVDEKMFARILHAGYGKYNPIVVLNQADTPALAAKGETVAGYLKAFAMGPVHILSLRNLSAAPSKYSTRA